MTQYSFGSGVLFGYRTDITNGTPINFGLIQSCTIEDSFDIKELYGQYQRPVAIARGQIKTTGKATVASISGQAYANLIYGTSLSTGYNSFAFGEAQTVPATPYQVTVANAAHFVADYGVTYKANLIPLVKVASGPTVGQYSVNSATGVYTFAAADTGAALLITYSYGVSASGESFTVSNQLLGTTPTFSASFYTIFQGKVVMVTLNNCTASKMNFASKLEDYTMPEFDFSCFADANNNIMTWNWSEAS